MHTQQNKLIKRLRKGWLNSLQAVYECDCLKLTTRVNEAAFLLKINSLGLKLERKVASETRYVSYRLVKR
jgi:hypothetical protein